MRIMYFGWNGGTIRRVVSILVCGFLCFIGTALDQILDQSGDYLGHTYGQQSTRNSYNTGSNYWYQGPYYYSTWYPTEYYGYYPYYYRSYGPWYYDNYNPWRAANVYGPYRTTYYWRSW